MLEKESLEQIWNRQCLHILTALLELLTGGVGVDVSAHTRLSSGYIPIEVPMLLWSHHEDDTSSLPKEALVSTSTYPESQEGESSSITFTMSFNTTDPSNPKGVTGKLSTWIANVGYSSIPSEVIERAKYLILDGIACGLVAAHLPWSEIAAKAIFKMEPAGQSSIIGWEGKALSPLAAAILNSTFIQGFELDDYHSRAPLHSNSLLLPALFAAAESEDQTFSGQDLLCAYVVGCEVGPRVGLALHGGDLLSRGWHSGAVQGPSASCAAVSSLLRLPPKNVEWGLGIACTQAGGLMSAQFGSMAKRMQHGFASRNGLYAALMAREGYTGIEEVYETPYGGFLSCFGQG
jgi:aconitate decarboxylase